MTRDTDELTSIYRDFGSDIKITEAEFRRLHRLAAEAPDNGDIVEIGSYRGGSTAALALSSKSRGNANAIYVFDPHDGLSSRKGTRYDIQDLFAFSKHMTRLGLLEAVGGPVLSYWSEGSEKAGIELWKKTSQTKQVGMLFHDGAHDKQTMRADLAAWLPHMQDEVVLVLHDSTKDYRYASHLADYLIGHGALCISREDNLTALRLEKSLLAQALQEQELGGRNKKSNAALVTK
jgi:hypothetical protein